MSVPLTGYDSDESFLRKPFVQDFRFETPDECECPGYPCEHVPVPRIATSLPYHGFSRPVTMAMAAALDEAGLWNVADLARKYAVDRPRWWHRVKRAAA